MIKRKSQSLLEYGIFLAVVIAVLLIMQSFIKRGYQGSLKSSSDRIGEQFSTSGSTIMTKRNLGSEGEFSETKVLQSDKSGVYTSTVKTGDLVDTTTQSKMDSAQLEKTRFEDYTGFSLTDPINDPDLPR
jgi:hypothetical protein